MKTYTIVSKIQKFGFSSVIIVSSRNGGFPKKLFPIYKGLISYLKIKLRNFVAGLTQIKWVGSLTT